MYQFVELNETEYDNFERQQINGTFVQSARQAELLKSRGYDVWLLGVKDKHQIVAAALVLREKIHMGYVFSIDHGPLLNFDQPILVKFFINGIIKFARQHQGLFIELRPNITYLETDNHGNLLRPSHDAAISMFESLGFSHQPFTLGMSTDGSPEWEYVKDLSDIHDDSALRDSYDKKVNYYLKKNAQFGVTLRYLKRADLIEFKTLTETTAKRLAYHDKDLDFYQKAYDIYGDEVTYVVAELDFAAYLAEERQHVELLSQKITKIEDKMVKYPDNPKFKRQQAEYISQKEAHDKRIATASDQWQAAGQDQVIVAGAMFIEQPQEITYLYSGTYETYMEYYGPYQIQDAMLRHAISKGIKRFNFYGIAGRFDGSDGVLKFKTVFNGHARQLIGKFILPVHPFKYRIYRTLKHMLRR
nr:peptidoglycan bridge formation glycyltransferase FemA/FemB family protein [Weissella diestrammenae]